jgi:glycosyltransferase involved in cell wall biosynthesis
MSDPNTKLISIIAPVYNEQAVLKDFYLSLCATLDELPYTFEIIFIDDGSRDNSVSIIHELQTNDARIGAIELSRNFGKEIALTAGLDHCHGDAAIIIDTDLQDPPALIGEMIQEWQNGYDVVYAQRLSREGESSIKKLSSYLFYRVIQRVGKIEIPADTGDFRLLNRTAIDAVTQLRERHRFMKGLFSWVGFRQKAIPFHRQPRHAGESKWNYWQLWNFALEGITSFTTSPLRAATYFGLVTALIAFLFGLYLIFDTLIRGNPVPGYPSLMVVVLFLGGIQLISIGIIGEYIARLFNEVKKRPHFFIQDTC